MTRPPNYDVRGGKLLSEGLSKNKNPLGKHHIRKSLLIALKKGQNLSKLQNLRVISFHYNQK